MRCKHSRKTRSHTLAPTSRAKARSFARPHPYRGSGRAVGAKAPFFFNLNSARPAHLRARLRSLGALPSPLRSVASSARPSLRSWLACSRPSLAPALRARSRSCGAPRAGGPACKKQLAVWGTRSWGARGRSLARMRPRAPLSLALGGARRAWALSWSPMAPVESPTLSSLPLNGCAVLLLVSSRARQSRSWIYWGGLVLSALPCDFIVVSFLSVLGCRPLSYFCCGFPLRPDGRTATVALTRALSPSERPHGRAGPRCPCCSLAARYARTARRCGRLWHIGVSLRLASFSAGALEP